MARVGWKVVGNRDEGGRKKIERRHECFVVDIVASCRCFPELLPLICVLIVDVWPYYMVNTHQAVKHVKGFYSPSIAVVWLIKGNYQKRHPERPAESNQLVALELSTETALEWTQRYADE